MTEDPTPPHRRTLVDRRKDEYTTLDKKIDAKFDLLTARLGRFIKKALIGFAVLGISCGIALLGFTLVLGAFQHQRYNVFVTNCEDSNDHNHSLLDLNEQRIEKLPTADQNRARKASEPYRAIINVAFPYRKDCKAYARARLKGERESDSYSQ